MEDWLAKLVGEYLKKLISPEVVKQIEHAAVEYLILMLRQAEAQIPGKIDDVAIEALIAALRAAHP